MALVKQGGLGGVQKLTDETLQQRLDRLSAGPTTNAAMASSAGATPDQAKMAGAGNRKQMVLKQAMQAGQTLKTGQEKAKEDAELTAGEQAELDAAKKLAGLSGVSSKLGQIAEQRLAGAATGVAQRSFKASEVDKLANPLTQPTENASIKQALLDYANDPTKREAALVTLANAKIMPEQINSLLENVDTVLNRNVQTSALAGTDIESAIQELGYSNLDDLAATLGRPTGSLAAMTLPEIQSAIEQKRQELTSRKAAVQTKAAGAGLGAAAAQQDIARFTKAGGLAQTEEAARPTIDFKAKIKLGDQDYDIETILKDEEFSNVIEQWLDASPADRAKLIPESWPLTAWLNANETSLKQSEAEGAAAGKQLMAAQSQVANLKDLSQDVLTAFVPGYEKGKIYSEAELASMKSAWESSAAFGLDMGFLNKLKADEIAMIKDGSVSKSDLDFMSKELPGIISGPAGKFMQDFGLTPGKSFYNSADLTKIKTIKSVLDSDPELLGADWAKGLPLDTLDTLSKNPSLKREVKEIRDDQIAFSNSANWTNDEYVNKIFGSPQQMDELNSRYAELREAAKYGDAEASAALVKLDDLDTDNDGDIDLADAKTITSGFKSTDINTYINDYNTNKSDYTPFSTTLGKNIEAGLAYKPGPEKQVAADILRGKVQLDFGNLGMLEKYMQQLPPNSDLHGQANRLIDNLVVNKSNEISNNYRIFSNAGNDILSGNMKAASVDQINSKIEELNTIINDPSQHPRVAERLRGTLNQLIESRTKVESVNAAAKLTGLNLSNLGKRADRYMQYLDSYNTKMFGKNWWNSSDYQRAAAGKPGKKSLPIYPWEAPRMTLIRNVIPNYYAYNRNGDALSLSIESYNNLKTEWDRLGSGSTGSNTSTGSNSTTSKKKTDKDSK